MIISFFLPPPHSFQGVQQDGRKLLKSLEAVLVAHGALDLTVDLGMWSLTAQLPSELDWYTTTCHMGMHSTLWNKSIIMMFRVQAEGIRLLRFFTPILVPAVLQAAGSTPSSSTSSELQQQAHKRQRHPDPTAGVQGASATAAYSNLRSSNTAIRVNMYQQQRGRCEAWSVNPPLWSVDLPHNTTIYF